MTLKLLAGLPANVVAVEAAGKVTDADYKNTLIPAVEACLKDNKKCRLLYMLGPDFTGFEAAAMWDDAKVGLTHFTSFERIAFVTDQDAYKTMAKVLGFAMPGEVKVFPVSDLEQARTWIAG